MLKHWFIVIAMLSAGLVAGLVGDPALAGIQPIPTPLPPPLQPLRAWTVADDGGVFVLDGANRLYQLAPADLAPMAATSPLFSPDGQAPVFLAADATRVVVGNTAISQTLVLGRANLEPVSRLNVAGPLALEPGRRLFMVPWGLALPPYTSVLWIYDLAGLDRPPQEIRLTCAYGPVIVDPAGRRLYVEVTNCPSSSPHLRDFYRVFDLDSLAELGYSKTEESWGNLGRLDVVESAGQLVTTYGGYGRNHLIVMDSLGRELQRKSAFYLGYTSVAAATGDWIYLLNGHGLWSFRRADLTLQSFAPITTTPPADLALSPAGDRLYLFGSGWLSTTLTAGLQGQTILPVSPFPAAWLPAQNTVQPGVLVYTSPRLPQDGVALLYLVPTSEFFRSKDGGRSWVLLPAASELGGGSLAFSPDFTTDQTLAVMAPPNAHRSTDGGDTWAAWTPPLAFVSDREGNREVYTSDPDGLNQRRLTDNPAADENPAWSPAWTRLAFQSNRTGNWDIFSLRPECPAGLQTECDLRQLTDNPADDMLPAWSPDGRRVAFVSTRDGNPELYLMDSDGRNQRRLTFHPAGDWRPAWLSDGQHLVFTSSRDGSNDIYRLAVPAPETPALTAEPEVVPLVTGPADDRDPAVGRGDRLFFLSNRTGFFTTYDCGLSSNCGEAEPFAETSQAEAHPAWFNEYTLLVARDQAGPADIYRLTPYSTTPLISSPGFDGQPARWPPFWRPDETAGREWLLSFENLRR